VNGDVWSDGEWMTECAVTVWMIKFDVIVDK